MCAFLQQPKKQSSLILLERLVEGFLIFFFFFIAVCNIGQVHLGQAEVEGEEVRKKHACFYIVDCSLLHETNSLASTRVCHLGWSPFQHKNCCRGLQALRSIDYFLAHCLYYIFQLIICNAFRLVQFEILINEIYRSLHFVHKHANLQWNIRVLFYPRLFILYSY